MAGRIHSHACTKPWKDFLLLFPHHDHQNQTDVLWEGLLNVCYHFWKQLLLFTSDLLALTVKNRCCPRLLAESECFDYVSAINFLASSCISKARVFCFAFSTNKNICDHIPLCLCPMVTKFFTHLASGHEIVLAKNFTSKFFPPNCCICL